MSLRNNFNKVNKIAGLVSLNKNNDIYSRIQFVENLDNPKNVSVKFPSVLNGFIRDVFNKSKRGIPLKLDETASKNYYLYTSVH